MAQGRKTGGGSRKGRPNHATATARDAFALLVEGNAEKLNTWLQQVAEGVKEPRFDKDGVPVLDQDGNPVMVWRNHPDPGQAFKLMMEIAEFCMPKLARTELTGTEGLGPVALTVQFVSSTS